jgi:hypothetical protein
MSGPKVVHIVTREEIEAICRAHLGRVETAMDELRRCAKRHDALDEGLSADLDRRMQALRRLFEEQQWSELQKQAPLTVDFLKSKTENIRAQAIAAVEKARSKRRRLADAARTLVAAIEASGAEPSAELRSVILRAGAAEDKQMAAMQAVLNENYAVLAKTRKASGPSKTQSALADRLASGETTQSFAEWLAEHNAREEKRDAR